MTCAELVPFPEGELSDLSDLAGASYGACMAAIMAVRSKMTCMVAPSGGGERPLDPAGAGTRHG